jgi:hypothetical protein
LHTCTTAYVVDTVREDEFIAIVSLFEHFAVFATFVDDGLGILMLLV